MTYPGVMPAGIPQLSSETQRQSNRSTLTTEMRIGKVVAYNAGAINLLIGGSVITNVAYLDSYRPILGDYVAAAHQGSQWVVLSRLAGNPIMNSIQNGSFEAGTVGGGAPDPWGVAHVFGSPAATVQLYATDDGSQFDGPNSLLLQQNTFNVLTQDYVYSNGIPVVPGEIWSLSAVVLSTSSDAVNSTVQVAIAASWYDNPGNVYPTTAAPTTFGNGLKVVPFAMWVQIPGVTAGITVPSGVNTMRVLVACTHQTGPTSGVSVFIDRVMAIKIKNADGTLAP